MLKKLNNSLGYRSVKIAVFEERKRQTLSFDMFLTIKHIITN